MNILIMACAGGMTSSLLGSKIVKAGNELGYKIALEGLGFNNSLKDLEKYNVYDILIIYTGGVVINKALIDTLGKEIKGVLIGPQIRYMADEIKKNLEGTNIPCESIDVKSFESMDGKAILKQALSVMNL